MTTGPGAVLFSAASPNQVIKINAYSLWLSFINKNLRSQMSGSHFSLHSFPLSASRFSLSFSTHHPCIHFLALYY
jgi:hypothetical protein